MNQFVAQYFKDFRSNFYGITAYILVAIYCLLSFSGAIYLGDYFVRDSDIFLSYFTLQPLIFLLIIPAIVIRVWGDENKYGTLELLLTQPMSYKKLILAKFFAVYSFFLLLIFLSLPFLLITACFSATDWGLLFSCYIGVLLSGAVFTALSCTVASLIKDNILSYIVSVFILLTLLYLPFEPLKIAHFLIPLETFSFSNHYNAFLNGLVSYDDLGYFLLIVLFSLWANTVILSYIRGQNKTTSLAVFLGIILLLFTSLLLSISFFEKGNFDLTSAKKFTFTPETKDFLETTDKRVDITLYEAQEKRSDTHSSYAVYAEYVERFLKQIESVSRGAVRANVVYVEAFSPLERQLLADGVPYSEDNVGNKIFMTAHISDNEGHFSQITAFSPQRQKFLESDLMRLLRSFDRPKAQIALFSAVESNEIRYFKTILNTFYSLQSLPSDFSFISPEYKTVILLGTSRFSLEQLLALDQFVLNGGNLLIFNNPSQLVKGKNKSWFDFLENYGFNPIPEEILYTDKDNESPFGFGTISNLEQKSTSVIFNESGIIETISRKDYTVFPLLSFEQKTLAAYSQGKFISAYLDLSERSLDILPIAKQESKVFFIYNTDIVKDYLISEEENASDFYTIFPLADNLNFILEILDLATNTNVEKYLPHYSNIEAPQSLGKQLSEKIRGQFSVQIKDLLQKLNEEKAQEDKLYTLVQERGFASVKNIGDLSDIKQRIDALEGELSRLYGQIIKQYQTAVLSLSIVFIFIIPLFFVLLLALILWHNKKSQFVKIRRLISDAETH